MRNLAGASRGKIMLLIRSTNEQGMGRASRQHCRRRRAELLGAFDASRSFKRAVSCRWMRDVPYVRDPRETRTWMGDKANFEELHCQMRASDRGLISDEIGTSHQRIHVSATRVAQPKLISAQRVLTDLEGIMRHRESLDHHRIIRALNVFRIIKNACHGAYAG